MSRFRFAQRRRSSLIEPQTHTDLSDFTAIRILLLIHRRHLVPGGYLTRSGRGMYSYHGSNVELLRITHDELQDRWIFHIKTSSGERRQVALHLDLVEPYKTRFVQKWDAFMSQEFTFA